MYGNLVDPLIAGEAAAAVEDIRDGRRITSPSLLSRESTTLSPR
jgi:hypothetical protein